MVKGYIPLEVIQSCWIISGIVIRFSGSLINIFFNKSTNYTLASGGYSGSWVFIFY
jgi:hypothetical protein